MCNNLIINYYTCISHYVNNFIHHSPCFHHHSSSVIFRISFPSSFDLLPPALLSCHTVFGGWKLWILLHKNPATRMLFPPPPAQQSSSRQLCKWVPSCLLLAGIFPHALHAAEASYAPKTVLQRLRSGAARAIGCRPTGASPWLACLLASYQCVDPEFVLVLNRIQLFRQVIKVNTGVVSVLLWRPPFALPQARTYEVIGYRVGCAWLDICRGWIFYGHRRQSVSCVFDSSPT